MIGDDECMFGHKAADVNMDSYALMMSREHGGHQIQIVSDDTDVFVLFLYGKLRPLAAITMKRFDGKTIDINTTVMALGDKCIQLLPMHAITGCDSVSYPFGKGKVSSLKVILDSGDLAIEVFGETNATISDVMCTECRMFGRLYGAKCDTTMNALRYKISSTRLQVRSLKSLPQHMTSRSAFETCPYPSHVMESSGSESATKRVIMGLRLRNVCWYPISST